MGITIVLSHSYCTIRIVSPPDNSPSSSSLCVFTGSAFVQPDAQTLLLSKAWQWCPAFDGAERTRANDCPLAWDAPPRPDRWTVHDDESGAWADVSGQLPLKRLAIYSPLTVGTAVVLNQMQRPASLCYPASVLLFRLRASCTGSGHISAGSTSHGNFSLIKFCSSIFALFTVASDCAAGFGVDERLDSCPFGRLVSCPQ